MPSMKQGENYEEVTPEEEEDIEEAAPRFDMKKIAIIGGVLALVVIAVFVVFFFGAKKKDATGAVAGDVAASEAADQEEYLKFLAEQGQSADDMIPIGGETVPQETVSVDALPSADDTKELRKWGYTADEIDWAHNNGISTSAMIDQAKVDQEEAQREALAVVSNTASPEYQNLLAMTWLGQPPISFDYTINDSTVYNSFNVKQNVDYVKCGEFGKQLFIRLELDDGSYAFMTLTPQRWGQLKDTGNIVVSLTTMEFNGVNFILDIKEIKP